MESFMSNNFTSTKCILCDLKAKVNEIDHGNTYIYLCSNHECGDIDISWIIRSKIEENKELRKSLRKIAASCDDKEKILEVRMDANNSMTYNFISKN